MNAAIVQHKPSPLAPTSFFHHYDNLVSSPAAAFSLMECMHATAAQPSNTAPHLLQAVISKWNDQATVEARGRYSAEVARIQKAHAGQCEAVQAQHDAVCQQIRQHNEAIWPQVTIAQAAQEELDRVGRFIQHIRLGMLLAGTENITHDRNLCFAPVDWQFALSNRQLSVRGLSTHAPAPQQATCSALVLRCLHGSKVGLESVVPPPSLSCLLPVALGQDEACYGQMLVC